MTNTLRGLEAQTKTKKLTKTGTDETGWVTTFKDLITGETWILDYPDSDHHGGGSPRLTRSDTE